MNNLKNLWFSLTPKFLPQAVPPRNKRASHHSSLYHHQVCAPFRPGTSFHILYHHILHHHQVCALSF